MVRVVFSLTTLPSRIYDLKPTLKSLHNQNRRVDQVYLTLPEKCKRLGTKYPQIPDKIKDLCEIVYVKEDYGPLTKIVGALLREKHKDTVIITVDDDVIYPETLVEDLLYYHKQYPKYGLSSSGLSVGSYPFKYSIVFNQQKNKWWFTMDVNSRRGRDVDILYGYPGALYKRGFFPSRSKVYKKFIKPALKNPDLFRNDDVYISYYLNSKNVPRKVVKIDDVINQSGNDALSGDVYKFFSSLERAIAKCEKMGWNKTQAKVKSSETFGAVCLVILILLLALLFGVYRLGFSS